MQACGQVSEQKPSTSFIPADHPNIAYIGRVGLENPASPQLSYPGTQIRADFNGTSIAMKVKSNSGYFMVEIDHQKAKKVASLVNDTILPLAKGLKDTTHTLIVTLAYEGYLRKPEFRGFFLDSNKNLPHKPILPTRKIEIIGNSITCGYGTEVLDPKAPFNDATENQYYTYAAYTARHLHAQLMVVARSGIGIYRNYNGPKNGNQDCMPEMYTQTVFADDSQEWDFNRFTPDVVCVNLGTNDCSTTPYNIKRLTDGYRKFIKRLRNDYPTSKIVLIAGPMLHGKADRDVKKAQKTVVVEANKRGDKEVYHFALSTTYGELGYGASYHPSKAQQYKNGAELTSYLRKLMNWN